MQFQLWLTSTLSSPLVCILTSRAVMALIFPLATPAFIEEDDTINTLNMLPGSCDTNGGVVSSRISSMKRDKLW